MTEQPSNGIRQNVFVVMTLKENAKSVKSALEDAKLLNKNFRMVPSASNPDTIALPVIDSFELKPPWSDLIVGVGYQLCPYSTKVMGQQRHGISCEKQLLLSTLSPVYQAILLTIETGSNIPDIFQNMNVYERIVESIAQLDSMVCPTSLEILGDDRTVVIPPAAFQGNEFWSVFQLTEVEREEEKKNTLANLFWRQLAAVHGSHRVVRRGTIDANSGIRQSGHRLLFPCHGVPQQTGPGSPGWIRVTEQGIKQSFDMTRVMFSRGNISEKIRFGKLVKRGETVLDMYAGIGYYTLPALIHGQARLVVACEWNEHAILALRYNVTDNKVDDDRVKIFQGDCRRSVADNHLIDMFDRVSLGLLPSSEGGWETAVCALKTTTGGWLHIHGNVPNSEKEIWAFWLCHQLLDICIKHGKPTDWLVICDHVERVKSFAPTVSHFVADVFLGKREFYPRSAELFMEATGRAMVCLDDRFIPFQAQAPVDIPSCALSCDGILSQSWMM